MPYLAVLTIMFFSCQNEGRWYPEAEVEIANYAEYTDLASGAKALRITLVIQNTGNTTISLSTITVKVRTDKHDYLQTANSAVQIIPGGK
jgi:hypothetical protein